MEKDIIADAREAYLQCEEAEADNRTNALDDLEFGRLGNQWPEEIAKMRKGRPCLTINRLPAFIRQITNDARQNKPSIKVHPADSGADVPTAEVINGLIRNIEYTSNADTAYDTGIDFAASMGWGYWTVSTEHASDDTFDLDLRINRVSNPFTIHGDPYSDECDSSDWNLAFEEQSIPKDQFKIEYPDAELRGWQSDDSDRATEADEIKVARYWTRDKVKRKLLKLSDGQVLFEDKFVEVNPETGFSMQQIAAESGIEVVGERDTMSFEVKHCLLSGADKLESDTWAGKYIPIIPVYGEELNIEGKRHFLSLIRQAKDAQKMFNVWRSASTELVGLAPKAPFIGQKGAFKSDRNWVSANTESHAYLEYDGNVRPERQPFSGVPAGALQEALNASDDMKSIMGLYDASLGARSNETSGIAIRTRQQEGDVSTFHFVDNMSRAIRHTGRILIDMIPHVYTGERIVRILGEDGTPNSVTVNTQEKFQEPVVNEQGQEEMREGIRGLYQLGSGKYDLTVTTGPSYTTRRQEAAEQMTDVIRAFPESAPVIAPRLAKNLDWPEAQEIAQDLEKMNPLNNQQDPMKTPEMMKAQTQLQMKQQEQQATLAMKQQELALKKQEAELNAQIKIAEYQLDKQQMQEKHGMAMSQRHEQQMSKLHGDTMNQMQPFEVEGGEMKHPLMMLVETVAMSAQATQQSMQQVAAVVAETNNRTTELVAAVLEKQAEPKTITMKTSAGKTLTARVD